MADSSNSNEETFETTTDMQATLSESLNTDSIENAEIKENEEEEASSHDVVAISHTVPNEVSEDDGNPVDSSTTLAVAPSQDQQAYSNLEPILVAMELGHEILQNNDGEQSQSDVNGDKDTADHMEVQATDANTGDIVHSDSTDTTSNVVSITQEQLATLFANSGGAGAGNVILTTSDGNGGQGGLALATILQDVVSGIQQNGGADSSGSAGSYYLVTQGGTIPIVMPSNITSSGETNISLVQASSGETAFVTVNQENLPEGVEGETQGTDPSMAGIQGSSVDQSGTGVLTTETADHELANAAAAAEHNSTTQMTEAPTSEAVPVVSTSVKRRLSNGPRVCTQCNKAFKYPSDLKKHLQIHTDIKKFKCEECNRFFRRLHQLVVHQRIHTGEKPYVCKHCGTAFRHDSTLTMHVRTRHEHKRPFKCTYCEHTFGRLSHLRKHVKKVCGPDKQDKQSNTIFQCKYCDVICTTRMDLRKHGTVCEKKENKAKPSQVALHVCNICNKDFASPYNVRRHQLTHSDDRPFECEYCNKSFKEKSSLTKHVKRVHLGKTKDDESLDDESSAGMVMHGINNQNQHLEVVSIHQNDESLLAASLQRSVTSSNGNPEETGVDSNALVQVAASVMVEELLHGEEQQHHDGSTTAVVPSSSDETMFVAEKTNEKLQENETYEEDSMMTDSGVSCMTTDNVVGTVETLSSSCLETTTTADEDMDSHIQQVSNAAQFETKPSEECSAEAVQGIGGPVILSGDQDTEEVVTSNENANDHML